MLPCWWPVYCVRTCAAAISGKQAAGTHAAEGRAAWSGLRLCDVSNRCTVTGCVGMHTNGDMMLVLHPTAVHAHCNGQDAMSRERAM